eukprot:8776569-Ditylum_brightwellii.AAC.1
MVGGKEHRPTKSVDKAASKKKAGGLELFGIEEPESPVSSTNSINLPPDSEVLLTDEPVQHASIFGSVDDNTA